MTQRTSRTGRWFWGGFIAVLLFGLLITLFAAIRSGTQWVDERLEQGELPRAWSEVIRVTLHGGKVLYLDPEALARVQTQMRAGVDAQLAEAHAQLGARLDKGVDRIFRLADARLPVFVDWYYSLGGEYGRLAYAAAGELGPYLTERLEDLVFGPAGVAEAIDELTGGLDQILDDRTRAAAMAVQDQIARLVRDHQAVDPGVELRVTGEWDLGGQLGEQFQPYLSPASGDMARQGLATSAGAAASAVTAKKLGGMTVAKAAGSMGTKTSLATLAGLASKLGLKSAAKAGAGAGTGAAAGAAICAATGVGVAVAPGCALVGGVLAGVGVWLLVDKAVIEAEEYLHRDDLEADLRRSLAEQREALRATLRERYLDGITIAFDGFVESLESGIRPITPKKDFVPADTIFRPAP